MPSQSQSDTESTVAPTPRPSTRLSKREAKAVSILCAIFSLRILGMYMVLPVLSPYASAMQGATGMLTGMAIGAYGLTQAIFQIPFGALSDRIGRKRTILIGLLLFALGSALAGAANNAYMLVAGRLVQGVGAVASVLVALAADLTRPEVRTQAMARLGMWIGASFAFGMIVGPFVAKLVGVSAIFWVTAALSVAGAVYLMAAVPEPKHSERDEQGRVHAHDLGTILRQKPLAMLDTGTFLLHLTLTAVFVVLPIVMRGLVGADHVWKILAPVVTVGLATMGFLARHSDKRGKSEKVFFLGASVFLLSSLILAFFGLTLAGSIVALTIFVFSVACLEPVLPALTTHFAVGKHRGSAMGVFHMSQFFGSFIGGAVGGACLDAGVVQEERVRWAFLSIAALVAVWIVLSRAVGIRPSHHLSP